MHEVPDDLTPMSEEEADWILLRRTPSDPADCAALAIEIGAMLRQLRERAGLTQAQVADASPTLHLALVSEWELGTRLHILQLHAGHLASVLGMEVFELVNAADCAGGFGGDFDKRVAASIESYLQEGLGALTAARKDGDCAEVERLEDRLGKLPTLDELAKRLGIATPLSNVDGYALAHAVCATGRQRGWTLERTK